MASVLSELEGTLLNDPDPFSYFMLVAFEASGVVRFTLLLLLWPLIRLLDAFGKEDVGLKVMTFVATAGVPESEIRSVARAVLPKFYMDDLDMNAWRVYSSHGKRVVMTKTPRIMVERFAKEHLQADEVIGSEIIVNRFGYATGFIRGNNKRFADQVKKFFDGEQPTLGLGRPSSSQSVLSLCKVSSSTS